MYEHTCNRQLREAAQQTSRGVSSEAPPTTPVKETAMGRSGHPSPAAKGRGKGQSGKVIENIGLHVT